MRISLIMFISLFSASIYCIGQNLEFNGTYQGKNIYVQNPFVDSANGFCTKEVFVNGKKCAFDEKSAFVIHLDSFHLNLDDSVKIQIVHFENCLPKVLYNNIDRKHALRFQSFTIDTTGILSWTTKEEISNRPFIVEQFRWNKWVKVGELAAKEGTEEHAYSFKVNFHSGENQFRLKQYGKDSIYITSSLIKSNSNVLRPTCKIKSGKIIFSSETMYEIYDRYGDIVKKGFGNSIDTSTLSRGGYYLNYDNTTMDFFL